MTAQVSEELFNMVFKTSLYLRPRHVGDHLGQKYLLQIQLDLRGAEIGNVYYDHVNILKLSKQSKGKRISARKVADNIESRKNVGMLDDENREPASRFETNLSYDSWPDM